MNNAIHRIGDEHRLAEEFLDFEAGWGGLARNLKSLLDLTDDVDGRGISVLDDAEQDERRPFSRTMFCCTRLPSRT